MVAGGSGGSACRLDRCCPAPPPPSAQQRELLALPPCLLQGKPLGGTPPCLAGQCLNLSAQAGWLACLGSGTAPSQCTPPWVERGRAPGWAPGCYHNRHPVCLSSSQGGDTHTLPSPLQVAREAPGKELLLLLFYSFDFYPPPQSPGASWARGLSSFVPAAQGWAPVPSATAGTASLSDQVGRSFKGHVLWVGGGLAPGSAAPSSSAGYTKGKAVLSLRSALTRLPAHGQTPWGPHQAPSKALGSQH